jgi:membrane protein
MRSDDGIVEVHVQACQITALQAKLTASTATTSVPRWIAGYGDVSDRTATTTGISMIAAAQSGKNPSSAGNETPFAATVPPDMDLRKPESPPWLDRPILFLREMRVEIRRDNIVLVAAGVSFYAVLAVLPALVIAVSLYGLFTDLDEAGRQIEAVLRVMPGSASQIIETQMRTIAGSSRPSLSIGFVVSLAAFAWTVSNATRAIVRGVKIAYDQENEQSILERRDIAVSVTVVGIVSMLVALALIAAVPVWLRRFDPTHAIVTFGNFRWVLVGGLFAVLAGLLYRFAPPRRPPHWRAVFPGTLAATVIWTVTSIGFSVYVSSFGRYNQTYGTLGAAVVLLLWFWFTSLAILVGAELNEVIDRSRGRSDSAVVEEGP